MSNAVRSAPSEGYATDAKAEYRREVWSAIKRHARTSLKYCRVMLMPSVEGLEIDVAEQYGCVREKIVAVDYNAAIAATVSRKYPGITAWGCDAFAAAGRARREGFDFDVLHFDMTCNISPAILDSLRRTAQHVRHGSVIVTNFLKGRESPSWLDEWVATCAPDAMRAFARTIERRANRDVLARKGMGRGRWAFVPDPAKSQDAIAASVRSLMSAHCMRRSLAVELATGWRQLGDSATYTSGRAPMQWNVWRA